MAVDGLEAIALQDKVIEVLRSCYDPEIPVNIYELGLVYETKVETTGEVNIKMTLTAPNCPAAGSLPAEIQAKEKAVPAVAAVKIDGVWDPPLDPTNMPDAPIRQIGMF